MEQRLVRNSLLYSEDVLKTFSEAKVLVCGLGGVGGTCFAALLRSGFNHLVIVDFDTVEESNLTRQILFNVDSLGKRNYYKEYCNNLEKQRVNLKGIEFLCSDYKNIIFPDEPCIVYCDPPYSNTKKYKYNDINYDEFWEWCREISIHNYVYVSSFEAPSDFKCIWEKERNISLTKDTGSKKNIERLFIKEN